MSSRSPSLPWIIESLIVAAVCALAAAWGQSLAISPRHVTAVWPPSGIALAVYMRRGRRVLPGIWLGELIPTALPFYERDGGVKTIAIGAIVGVAFVGQVVLGRLLAQRFADNDMPLKRARSALLFMLLAGGVACLVAPSIGVMTMAGGGLIRWEAVGRAWLNWYLGDMAGVVIFAPCVLAWSEGKGRRLRPVEAWETAVVSVALLATLSLIFWQEQWFHTDYPFMFLLLPCLTWVAFRFGRRRTTTVLMSIATLAVWFTSKGHGPFVQDEPRTSFLLLESFFAVVNGTTLIVAAANAERRDADDRLDDLRQQLMHTSRLTSMSEMAGGLAHELGQPLGAIANNAQAGLRGHRNGKFDSDDIDATFQAISEDADRASEVIRSLRSLITRSAPRRVECDLNSLAVAIVRLFERGMQGRIEVQRELDSQIPRMRIDPVQIQQALLNLLQNGLDSMQTTPADQRTLRLSTSLEDDAVHIRVADTGMGLPDGDAAKVFDSFYSTKDTGMGLGLRITRLIVEEHEGKIWLSPNADRGVTAHLILPLESQCGD
ncbi:MAG: MASE1 domain-containing protein [Planctomycetales bacterium]|nr:MASE1 domain-containing protein [Planctomycetales bacterium]